MKKLLLLPCFLFSSIIFAQDPALRNVDFDVLAKKFGNPCSCTHWLNQDLGATGPFNSTSGGATGVRLNPDNEDAVYQEVAVIPNTFYKLTYTIRIDNTGTSGIDLFEIRVLKGSSYRSGYTPVYYAEDENAIKPQSGFGYNDLAQVEVAANSIVVEKNQYPGSTDYIEYDVTFSSGSETSIAVFARDIGDTSARVDRITLTNEGSSLSVDDIFKASLTVYPNPAKTSITVKSNSIQIESVEIYDMLGKNVLKSDLVNDRINVSNLTSGIYMLKVNSANSSSTRKIVID